MTHGPATSATRFYYVDSSLNRYSEGVPRGLPRGIFILSNPLPASPIPSF